MQPNHASPLSGSPKTRVAKDKNGKPVFRLSPRVLTPARRKAADKIIWTFSALWLVRCVFVVFSGPSVTLIDIAWATGLFFAGQVLLSLFIAWAMSSRTEIEMSLDTLRVRRWFFWRSFDRMLVEEFGLLHHDKAEEERFAQELIKANGSKRGQVLQPIPYYMRSFHVVMSYAGQRIDLLSVYGQKDAAAIVARLQLCNSRLDQAAGIRSGRGSGSRPGEEWGKAPGGVAS